MLHRQVFAEVPVRVEYFLMDLGPSLRVVVDSVYAWGSFTKPRRASLILFKNQNYTLLTHLDGLQFYL